MIKWFKDLFHVVRVYKEQNRLLAEELQNLKNKLNEQEGRIDYCFDEVNAGVNTIKERTDISADVTFSRHAKNQIVVIGRYKNCDYIQTYSILDNDFDYLINMLKDMQRHGVVSKIDAVPHMSAVLKRETP